MGMVFQNFALLPHLNVLENIAFPSSIQGIDRADARAARARGDRAGRPARPRALLSARALRRPAAARRHRPQPRHQAGDLVPRRAVLGARSADPARDAGRADAAAERAAQDHRLHHPRFRRGDPARRPHRHHEGRRGHPDRHAGAAGPQPGHRLRRRIHPRRAARQGDLGAQPDARRARHPSMAARSRRTPRSPASRPASSPRANRSPWSTARASRSARSRRKR